MRMVGRMWYVVNGINKGSEVYSRFETQYRNKFSVGKQLAKALVRPIRWQLRNRTKTVLGYSSLYEVFLG